MRKIFIRFVVAFAFAAPLSGVAQTQHFGSDAGKRPYLLTSADTVRLNYDGDFKTVAVAGNTTYTASCDADWLTLRKESNGSLTLFGKYNYESSGGRRAQVSLASADGQAARTLVVEQAPNQSALLLKGDTKHEIRTASASSSQAGEGIERSYDGDLGTLYHSAYGGGTKFPVTLTYTLKSAQHVDYALYTTRQSGDNGNFGEVEVEYALSTAPSKWVKLGDYDFREENGAFRIDFGKEGIDKVMKVRFTVRSGHGGFASCAEMGFYENNNSLQGCLDAYFADALCSQLRPGVTEATLPEIKEPYVRQLVHFMLQGEYSTKYRVGEFEPYRSLGSLAAELKCGTYNRYENPTGIYFRKGEPVVLFVDGITDVAPTLIIKSFGRESYEGEGQPESSYPLHNGANVIMPSNRGNGYIYYFSDNFATLPNVRIHFAMASENGYFDAQRGDTNEDWERLLANATSDIMDIRSQRLQMAVPVADLRRVCPKDGVRLAEIYNEVVFREREIMGLARYGREPKNRQFGRCVPGGIFADGIGAAIYFDGIGSWANPEAFGYWGLAHELGHVNQTSPGFKWTGCTETTNNVYSAWVNHKMSPYNKDGAWHNLEDEETGIYDYSGMCGGRFNSYLNEGVRKGRPWQLQEGPDYFSDYKDDNMVTVEREEADGTKTGEMVTVPSRNFDHFVKVVPFWQLELYCMEMGVDYHAFGKMIEAVRKDNTQRTNGQHQIQFMRTFCDSTKINFLPFFERAGMLKPIDRFVEDYNRGWNIITEDMIKELKDYIEAKNYAPIPKELNYINVYNWETFRDKGVIDETIPVNTGCSRNGNFVTVDNEVWKNAVAFETYNSNDELVRISMYCLRNRGERYNTRYTQVLFPLTGTDRASYIMAVGYDGQRVKCYQR